MRTTGRILGAALLVLTARAASARQNAAPTGSSEAATESAVVRAFEQRDYERALELLSRVQRLRKEADLPYDARIALAIAGDPPILEAAEAHQDLIRREALVRTFALGTPLAAAEQEASFELDGFAVHLMVARLAGGPAFVSSTTDAT